MNYYVGECGKQYKVKSFTDGQEKLINNKGIAELEKSGSLIGYNWGLRLELLSKYASYEVAEDKVDLHYLKKRCNELLLGSELEIKAEV